LVNAFLILGLGFGPEIGFRPGNGMSGAAEDRRKLTHTCSAKPLTTTIPVSCSAIKTGGNTKM
jgi:hypothetical protein